MKKTICLNMIVKNEANIIHATLENILQHIAIDYWVIADTGSTDNTIQVIQDFFQQQQIQGEIHQHTWKNFEYNRQQALNAAAHKTDYVLFFDADDRITGDLKLPDLLDQDAYTFQLYNDGMLLPRQLLVKNNQTFYWRGETHEVITAHNPMYQSQLITGDYRIFVGHFGARSQDPDKYLKDALNLVKSFHATQDSQLKQRYAYFCAQSFICAKDYTQAESWLLLHIQLSTAKTEQIRYAYIVLGRLYGVMERPHAQVDAWLKAYDHAPLHNESLGLLAEHFGTQGYYQLAFDFADRASRLTTPSIDQVIILNSLIHQYTIDFQLAYSAYKLNKNGVLYSAVQRLLQQPELNEQLTLFIIESFLYTFEQYAKADTTENLHTIYNCIQTLNQLNALAQQKKTRLLERLITHFQGLSKD